MNWVVSWVDVSIYPVLAAYYLGYFIPALRDGATIGGMDGLGLGSVVAGRHRAHLVYLRSANPRRAAGGPHHQLAGRVHAAPAHRAGDPRLLLLVQDGNNPDLPFLAGGQALIPALSTGLFVVMWNYMGWELPSAAGDEIVNPRKTYPRAMALVLVAAILTYALPTVAGLYGGGGRQWPLSALGDRRSGVGRRDRTGAARVRHHGRPDRRVGR